MNLVIFTSLNSIVFLKLNKMVNSHKFNEVLMLRSQSNLLQFPKQWSLIRATDFSSTVTHPLLLLLLRLYLCLEPV